MKIASVRFREGCKVYDFDATGVDLVVGDRVIVESDRGVGFAHVVRIRHAQELPTEEQTSCPGDSEVRGAEPPAPGGPADSSTPAVKQEGSGSAAPQQGEKARQLRKIVRKATEDDITRSARNGDLEKEAFKTCQELIAERELPMKLISVEYAFDASRATFYFFSESRVDFRELVKELAHKLKSRIEMRQIGVRDVARTIGGFGPCGRELCCASYLRNFEPVSIRMAKKQEMVLNPAKISGVCGRLLCCLSYEYDMYEEIKKDVADLRERAAREKKEESELRLAAEREEAEERRLAEEKRRQEERRQQEQRRDRQKDNGQKGGGKQEKKREQPEEKKTRSEQGRERPQQQRQEGQLQQKAQQPQQQQQGEKQGKKNKRRFWRNKNKRQQGEKGQIRPQGGPDAQGE